MEKQLRITGQDLARRRGVDQITVSNNGACLVCGHPTGDCVSDDAATEVWSLAPPEHDPLVHVVNDVWVDRPSPGAPSRPMTSLMIAGGTKRRLSEVLTVIAHGYDVQYLEVTDHPVRQIEDKDLPAVLRHGTPEVSETPDPVQPVTAEPQVEVEEVVVEPEQPVVTPPADGGESADPAIEEAVSAGAAEDELADEELPAALRPTAKKSTTRRKSA